MQKKSTKLKRKKLQNQLLSNSPIELLSWPAIKQETTVIVENKVIAIQTTRSSPETSDLTLTNSPFDGFNLGLHVNDDSNCVEKNRAYLQRHIQEKTADKIDIQWLEQVHGSNVVEIDQVSKKALVADACITRNKNIALAIMTADCLPILLCNVQKSEIAVIHGGWRPLAANIIANTLAKMRSDVNDIEVWLGPCIGDTAFEVGEDVKLAFTRQNSNFSNAFILQKNEKYLADLHVIAKMQLSALNVSKISVLKECTYNLPNKYYSYRRESITGRMASVICLLG